MKIVFEITYTHNIYIYIFYTHMFYILLNRLLFERIFAESFSIPYFNNFDITDKNVYSLHIIHSS